MDWIRPDKRLFENSEPFKPDEYVLGEDGKPLKDTNGKKVKTTYQQREKQKFEQIHEKSKVGKAEKHSLINNIGVSIQYQGLRTSGVPDLDKAAKELLATEKTKHHVVLGFPAPKDGFWKEWGNKFGKYTVVVTKWGGKIVVNLLHECGESVYWEMYKFQGDIWYIQNNGIVRIKETKTDRVGFEKWMTRRLGKNGWVFLLHEIYGFILE